MERLVVIWCPVLLEEGPRGEEARRFARVLARAGELCPWVHPIRLGVGALPVRGPARFFGGEEAVVGASRRRHRRARRSRQPRRPRGRRQGRRGGQDRHCRRALRRDAGCPLGADRPAGGHRRLPRSVVGGHAGASRPGRHPAAPRGHDAGPVRRVAGGERLGPLRRGRSGLPHGGARRERGAGGAARPRHRAPAARRTRRGPRPSARRAARPRSPASSVVRRRPTRAPPAPSCGCRSAWGSRPC